MKKVKLAADELRPAYKREDFGVLVRGKYASRRERASNVIVLRPELASAFPNGEVVNDALMGLIRIARAAARPDRRSGGRTKTRKCTRITQQR